MNEPKARPGREPVAYLDLRDRKNLESVGQCVVHQTPDRKDSIPLYEQPTDIYVTVTLEGKCVAVTRQNDEGQMLEVLWQAPTENIPDEIPPLGGDFFKDAKRGKEFFAEDLPVQVDAEAVVAELKHADLKFSPVAMGKITGLSSAGYVVNGVAMMRPFEHNRRCLVDYLGFVGWLPEQIIEKPVETFDPTYPDAERVAQTLENASDDLLTEARFVRWQAAEIERLKKG